MAEYNHFDQFLDAYKAKSKVPVWLKNLTRTLVSKNITIEDWNDIVMQIRYIASDSVSVYDYINAFVAAGFVFKIKGSAEEDFRQGEVIISPVDLNLGNVDNTSDKDKPLSTAQINALNALNSLIEGLSNSKLDKSAAPGFAAYTHVGDKQIQTPISQSAFSSVIVQRISGGQITVPETHSNKTDATSKKYVDERDDAIKAAAKTYADGSTAAALSTAAGYVATEEERAIAAELALSQRIEAQEGLGGALDAYDFGIATPAQQALTDYALSQIPSINGDALKIWNGTRVTNLFDNNVWQLTNTQNTSPTVFEWANIGSAMIAKASNETLGIVKGSDTVKVNSSGEMYTSIGFIGALSVDQVVNDLVTGGIDVPLSAEQGKALSQDAEILKDRVETIITTPVEGVSAQEIIDARAGEVSLGAKVRKIDLTKAEKTYVDTLAQGIASGSPKGTYPNLATLNEDATANTDSIYITLDDGKWCYYDTITEAFVKGGVYQATAIADGAVTPEKASFIDLYSATVGNNKYNPTDPDISPGKYIDTSGATDTNDAYRITGFIPAKAGDNVKGYHFEADGTTRTTPSYRGYALYNSDKQIIVSVSTSTAYNLIISPEHTTCAYIRLVILAASVNCYVAINPVAAPTVFEPYEVIKKYILADSVLTAEPKNITLIANGDSIVYGHQSAMAGYEDMVNEYGYVHMACARLGLSLKNYAISSSTLTENTDGTDTHGALINRYTSMDNDGDIVYISIGSNDWFYDNSEIGVITDRVKTTFYGAMNLLIIGLKEKYPGKPILFGTPIKRWITRDPQTIAGNLNFHSEPISGICEAIKATCEYHSVRVLDLYALSQLCPWEESDRAAYLPDGTHPNGAGHSRMAVVLASELKNIIDGMA